ncbi:pyridoxal-phosphate dependent enzyme [Mesorhizobium sp. M7A.F.Ca.US.011.01.1.1]|uniref:pyridoxal-phosphate dependent enzyme n=1 Tax=Mesorhizobium sp. M7A.F.Ca.US.011.01.1.1 TaxID=2496741 RepID=UPI000FCB4B0C|nr:pyridoxal-phosphate dependent enzyme [Mesorhizobium sp. M7A.F.Ca.US.011.01.1.1]RUX25847.1 pyridoxal-phosphate dependent enzyme [Mesorhizobium sp. M7A.F.Ca.US.011.01.1.1]
MTLAVLPEAETSSRKLTLRCIACNAILPPTLVYRCPDCGGILEVVHQKPEGRSWLRADFVADDITLGEGGTPLRELRPDLLHAGFKGRLLAKDETRNPSGSFKDRLVAAALSRAIALGATGIVSASSGNAGAAAACYAANAGIPAIIVCPDATPRGKLAQIVAYGATLEQVPGHYGNAFEHARLICAETGYANLTTTYLNPYGVDALRLIGQELHEQMEGVGPDWIAIPTSSGPLVKGVFQGFMDRAGKVPRLIAAQSEGCAPIARAFREGKNDVDGWETPKTIASGISDPLLAYPEEGSLTLSLVRASKGVAHAVGDADIREAMIELARKAGLFCEPTGAASLAAARDLFVKGTIGSTDTVVCIVTGHGFKDFAAWT